MKRRQVEWYPINYAVIGALFLVAGQAAEACFAGYINESFPQGYHLVSAGLISRQPLSETMQSPPEGTFVVRFNETGRTTNHFSNGVWDDPTMKRPLGEGMIVYSPEPWSSDLTGCVPVGLLKVYVPTKGAAVGSPIPQAGHLRQVLQFPEVAGTKVSTINPSTGTWQELASYTATGWVPAEPILAVGQAIWVETPQPLIWERRFSVNGVPSVPDFVATQPADARVEDGNPTILSVATKESDVTYDFQWQRNGRDIAGANGSQLIISSAEAPNEGAYWVRVGNNGTYEYSDPAHLVLLLLEGRLEAVPVGSQIQLTARELGSKIGRLESTQDFDRWDPEGNITFENDAQVLLPIGTPSKFFRLHLE